MEDKIIQINVARLVENEYVIILSVFDDIINDGFDPVINVTVPYIKKL